MKMVKIGFLGMGNIGSGVVRVLRKNAALLRETQDVDFLIVRALVRDVNKAKGRIPGLGGGILTTDVSDIVDNPDVDIVVEVMGGGEPAATYMERALLNGKTVVSANKSAVAPAWPRLEAAARKSGAGLYYEASAGGGVPVIDVLKNSMQANHITSVMGIINGTTNYMLWRMLEAGMDYDAALAEAQELGYAEPDPTFDVGGMDAVFKLSILASLAFRRHVPVGAIAYDGITQIAAQDISLGKKLGMTLKLLGIGKDHGDSCEAHVYPTFIPNTHPMASVQDAFNAIYLTGDMVGESMLYGRGAGALPTASAIVSDLVRASKTQKHAYCTFFDENGNAKRAVVKNDAESAFFLRFAGEDTDKITRRLAAAGLKVRAFAAEEGECAVLVEPAREETVREAAKAAGDCRSVIRAEL